MPMVDVPKRQAAELEKLLKKVRALIKDKMYCEMTHGAVDPNSKHHEYVLYWIEITGPYDLGADLRDLVNACPNFVYLEHHEFKGSFDWASDTYLKDSSAVKFTIK